MSLILASQSPRRRELLSLFRLPFTVCVPQTDETMDPDLPIRQEVERVSRQKALAVPCAPEDTVVAADTVVVCDGKALGKPRDEADALQMLQLLSGRSHQVITGLCVRRGEKCVSCYEETQVHFRTLSREEILEYIRTGEPMDKAGSYGIQGGAALFVTGISGDYYNVMGLPVCRLGQLLKSLEATV